MEQLKQYIKPELLIVAFALYFLGLWFKQLQSIKDKYIPFILGGIGTIICALYVFATTTCVSLQEAAMSSFTIFTQGILVAGLSTYIDQLIKQKKKVE